MNKVIKRYKQLKESKSGFTIIELVVTVAIIAILALIVIPNFREYLDSAREAQAREAIKQTHTAIQTARAIDGVYLQNGNEAAENPGKPGRFIWLGVIYDEEKAFSMNELNYAKAVSSYLRLNEKTASNVYIQGSADSRSTLRIFYQTKPEYRMRMVFRDAKHGRETYDLGKVYHSSTSSADSRYGMDMRRSGK